MMKRMILFLVLTLFLVSVASAQENVTDWLYDSSSVEYQIRIGSSFVPSNNPKDVEARITLKPKDNYMQKVNEIETNPEANIQDEKIIFNWKGIVTNPQSYEIKTNVEINNNFPKVPKKINYPLEVNENLEYLKSTNSVDVNNDEMLEIVSDLIRGEDDTLVVAHKLAEWVRNNIDYSLSTMTAEASLNSTWVLENRKGVCDEITNLYLAMTRSAGIPSRFVSGFSYTNSPEFPEGWGSHGWAEIYLPEYGWIPVDVTYGQFGRLDIGHISLKTADDAINKQVEYKWKVTEKESRIDTSGIEASADSLSHSRGGIEFVHFEISPLRKQLGFGSYNVVELEVENLRDYYVSEEFRLVVPEGSINVIDNKNKWILLEPNEKKKVYWLIKAEEDLDKNYIYTAPVVVYTLNDKKESSIKLVANDKVYSLREMQEYIHSSEEVGDTGKLLLLCSSSDEKIIEGNETKIKCELTNNGDEKILDLEICFDNKCKNTFLDIGESKTINENINVGDEGIQNVRIMARNGDINVLKIVPLNVESKRSVDVNIKISQEEVEYYDEIEVTFNIITKGDLRDIKFELLLNGDIKGREIINKSGSLSYALEGKLLRTGENSIMYKVTYNNGEELIEEKGDIKINLVNVNFWQKIKIFFRNLI